ncbi:hypothetical protein GC176_25405 [bacterium]|nr:hypothetical protein [bacterium]
MEPFVTDIFAAETCRIRPRDLAEIASSLFNTMLGLPFALDVSSGCFSSEEQLEANIRILGCWNAELRVRAPQELARRIACAMFDLNADDLTEADVRDALGEVANVIGGSVKGILNSDCDLTLPAVDTAATNCETCSLCGTFECCGQPVSIALIEKQTATA